MPQDPFTFLSQSAKSDTEKQVEDAMRTARSVAVRWIGLGRKPSGQVRDYLRRQGFDADVIDHVIDELKAEQKIDDMRLAHKKAKARLGAKSESALRVSLRLAAQGLEQEAIDQVLEDRPADQELALAALQGKFTVPQPGAGANDLKLRYNRFLMSRGFSPECIRGAIREFLKGTSEPDDFDD